MNQAFDIVSKILSVVLYPLFIPTYGIALFCYFFSHQVAPLYAVWTVIAITGTLVLTCILPITTIWVLMKMGKVQNMQIENAEERTLPYLYAVVGFLFWCYLLISVLHAPVYINTVAVGATAAIGLVALINRKWKISAHLTGFGGFTGGLMTYCLGAGLMPSWILIAALMVLSLLLMYARLHLRAHTPEQVAAGWLMGLFCTFVPYCIITYVA